ncbi:MAG: hypothetical protein HKN45_11270 [Flavobacteriales bacterium]|nr:hypothetical protein [Flavobacteriales bacterium]
MYPSLFAPFKSGLERPRDLNVNDLISMDEQGFVLFQRKEGHFLFYSLITDNYPILISDNSLLDRIFWTLDLHVNHRSWTIIAIM